MRLSLAEAGQRLSQRSWLDRNRPSEGFRVDATDPLERARQAMIATGQWDESQSMGRIWPIGCVALEITQRCNLDCAACYLSTASEAVKDVPLDELFRRIDMLRATYGPYTAVQVTGGDPTLRKPEEVIAIVRRIRERDMVPSLFTNGIKVTRGFLTALAHAGLAGVAFHVDMTQRRRGYDDEVALNEVRRSYVDRARGLPLDVFFNMTVYDGNLLQIPGVVQFFVRHSDVVRMASFQPVATVGRGSMRRSGSISVRAVMDQIERGAKTSLAFDTAHVGHRECNRYATALVVNGGVYDLLDDKRLYYLVLAQAIDLHVHGQTRAQVIRSLIRVLANNPYLAVKGAGWLARQLWRIRAGLVAARGRVNKLSFFIHNFMDACDLDPARLAACVFKVATADGAVPMCLHNAERDTFILGSVPNWRHVILFSASTRVDSLGARECETDCFG